MNCTYNRIQELNNKLTRLSSSKEMSHVIEQELAIVKEEKLSQAATSSMIALMYW